jgi:hypothetical protein
MLNDILLFCKVLNLRISKLALTETDLRFGEDTFHPSNFLTGTFIMHFFFEMV